MNAFYQPQHHEQKNVGPELFCGEPNQHVLTVLHPIILRWGDIFIMV
jgi:hypothetical protein